jgi:aspartate--ammonia ligase
LAKWKRWQLKEYQVPIGNGIFVDMRAIRRDDDMDNTHSIYVDQWDWEATLEAKDRNVDTLKLYASKIYESVKRVMALNNPPNFTFDHPLHFVHAKDLYNRWPELTPQQREYNIVKEHRAVFIIGIGGPLNEKGDIHGGRSSSYDSWISQTTDMPEGYHGLNGDLVIWSDVLEAPIEVSSMGIRVNAQDLKKQMALKGDETASENTPYF